MTYSLFKSHTPEKPRWIAPLPSYLITSLLSLAIFSTRAVEIQGASLPSEPQCQKLWAQQSTIKPEIEGWCLLIDRTKGNCLACHNVDITNWPSSLSTPGNAAPLLENIQEKYPTKPALKNLIYDASRSNPNTFMPLFGKHRILSEKEIDLIVEYLMGNTH